MLRRKISLIKLRFLIFIKPFNCIVIKPELPLASIIIKKDIKMKCFLFAALAITLFSCNQTKTKTTDKKDVLAKASREDKNGWIYVHLEGSPSNIGYQHGYLLANDIDTSIQAVSYYLTHETKRDWSFYRQAA